MAVHYRPILSARQSELDALADISSATWRRMTPILELTPAEDQSWAQATTSFRRRLADSSQVGMRVGVDTAASRSRTSALADVVLMAREVVVDALPVLGLTDASALAEIRQLGIDPHELMLRLRPPDLRLSPAGFASAAADLLTFAGLERSDVDLLVDLGPLPNRLLERQHAVLIRVLSSAGWRSRTLVSGAFPRSLPPVQEEWEPVEIPRRDEMLWRKLRAELDAVGLELDYGDYGAAHPAPPSSGGRAAPHLRYALEGRWLVVRGRRYRPQEFFEVCRRIGAHPEFTEELGAADEKIARRAREGPSGGLTCGNSATWKELSTAHHLEFVVRQLAG